MGTEKFDCCQRQAGKLQTNTIAAICNSWRCATIGDDPGKNLGVSTSLPSRPLRSPPFPSLPSPPLSPLPSLPLLSPPLPSSPLSLEVGPLKSS